MKKLITEARASITTAIQKNGPYSHNIIGLVLSNVAKQLGDKAANGLIEQMRLYRYGFHPVGRDLVQRRCYAAQDHVWRKEREVGTFCGRCDLLLTAFQRAFGKGVRV